MLRGRRGVVLSSRVHPGESNSSWMMKGAIDFLTGNSLDAKILRDNFVFKVRARKLDQFKATQIVNTSATPFQHSHLSDLSHLASHFFSLLVTQISRLPKRRGRPNHVSFG